jgi:hypothetical protein
MTDAEGRWSPHPDAVDNRVDLSPICDLLPPRDGDPWAQDFSVHEFATLADGRRVILHKERGFSLRLRSTGGMLCADDGTLPDTRDDITQQVLNVVLPDDDEPAEEHPWSWLAELARARGLDVTADDLRGLPYEVVLTDALTRQLAPG